MKLQDLNSSNFDAEVQKSNLPVIVDFWAQYCGPCKAMTPTLEQLAEENSQRYRVYKVDAQTEPALANRFGVRSLPTLVFLSGGKVVGTHVGAGTKASLEKKINSIFK